MEKVNKKTLLMLNKINVSNNNHKRSNTMFSQSISINQINLISNSATNNDKSDVSKENQFIAKSLEPYIQVDSNLIAFISKLMKNINLTSFIKSLFCMSFKNSKSLSQFSIKNMIRKYFIHNIEVNTIYEMLILPFFVLSKKKNSIYDTINQKYIDSFNSYQTINIKLIIMKQFESFSIDNFELMTGIFKNIEYSYISVSNYYMAIFFLLFTFNQAPGNNSDSNTSYDKKKSDEILIQKAELLFSLFDYDSRGFIESSDKSYQVFLRLIVFFSIFYSDYLLNILLVNQQLNTNSFELLFHNFSFEKVTNYINELVLYKKILLFMSDPNYMKDFINYISHNFIFTENRSNSKLNLKKFKEGLKETDYALFYPTKIKSLLIYYVLNALKKESKLFFEEIPKIIIHYNNLADNISDEVLLNTINHKLIKQFNMESKFAKYDSYLQDPNLYLIVKNTKNIFIRPKNRCSLSRTKFISPSKKRSLFSKDILINAETERNTHNLRGVYSHPVSPKRNLGDKLKKAAINTCLTKATSKSERLSFDITQNKRDNELLKTDIKQSYEKSKKIVKDYKFKNSPNILIHDSISENEENISNRILNNSIEQNYNICKTIQEISLNKELVTVESSTTSNQQTPDSSFCSEEEEENKANKLKRKSTMKTTASMLLENNVVKRKISLKSKHSIENKKRQNPAGSSNILKRLSFRSFKDFKHDNSNKFLLKESKFNSLAMDNIDSLINLKKRSNAICFIKEDEKKKLSPPKSGVLNFLPIPTVNDTVDYKTDSGKQLKEIQSMLEESMNNKFLSNSKLLNKKNSLSQNDTQSEIDKSPLIYQRKDLKNDSLKHVKFLGSVIHSDNHTTDLIVNKEPKKRSNQSMQTVQSKFTENINKSKIFNQSKSMAVISHNSSKNQHSFRKYSSMNLDYDNYSNLDENESKDYYGLKDVNNRHSKKQKRIKNSQKSKTSKKNRTSSKNQASLSKSSLLLVNISGNINKNDYCYDNFANTLNFNNEDERDQSSITSVEDDNHILFETENNKNINLISNLSNIKKQAEKKISIGSNDEILLRTNTSIFFPDENDNKNNIVSHFKSNPIKPKHNSYSIEKLSTINNKVVRFKPKNNTSNQFNYMKNDQFMAKVREELSQDDSNEVSSGVKGKSLLKHSKTSILNISSSKFEFDKISFGKENSKAVIKDDDHISDDDIFLINNEKISHLQEFLRDYESIEKSLFFLSQRKKLINSFELVNNKMMTMSEEALKVIQSISSLDEIEDLLNNILSKNLINTIITMLDKLNAYRFKHKICDYSVKFFKLEFFDLLLDNKYSKVADKINFSYLFSNYNYIVIPFIYEYNKLLIAEMSISYKTITIFDPLREISEESCKFS